MYDDEDDDVEDEESGLSVTSSLPSVEVVLNYRDLIAKVRKAVKIFKKSPTKNDIYLQKYVQKEHGKRLELILDCKTRWNSLLNMLERFYNLRLCISKALIDIGSEIYFTDEEWSKINDLKLCLELVKLGLEGVGFD
ncbi:crossover junction endonuclease mus81-like protein [Lasius niger]|uniref:Crossover junction endonuclease mus81-like protein n=1 Tax=Lasius niger TaxID=67767 RepID=A0A0J7KBC5_LASNI|nr:crossover junction endonuclease mus81-like protein [Lasius niger]